MRNKSRISFATLIIAFLFVGALVLTGTLYVNQAIESTENQFGPPAPNLAFWEKLRLSIDLSKNGQQLFLNNDSQSSQSAFLIQDGENVATILGRLSDAGMIANADLLLNYLVYTGLDRQVRSGEFQLASGQSAIEIAQSLLDPVPGQATISIFPGWRLEEIAESLQASGLEISPQDFMDAAYASEDDYAFLSNLPIGHNLEGYLIADTYLVDRAASASEVIAQLLNFSNAVFPTDLIERFADNGLNLHQALTLASIVEREGVVPEEMPMIASVFLNRLAIDMRLEADPTVQYSFGYDENEGNWWVNPILAVHLALDSRYNTYINPGLPPGPIASPSLAALLAVAEPADSEFFFFQAQCDGSGLHNFALTYAEHTQNNCP